MMNLSDMADLSQEMQEGIVSLPKEVILISLVSQEQALYNPKHENYRNTHRKDIKWMEIAENVGWTEVQCKAKWKAMRDQYCRELKRSKFNNKANVKWKYFKELDFLRPYALARNYRPRNPTPLNNNTSTSNNNTQNQNTFNCAPATDNMNHSGDNNNAKFATIKIESNATGSFATCDFSTVKTDTATNLTEEQLNNVLQQQSDDHNWTYITTGSSTSSNNNSRLDNHSLSDTAHLLSSHTHHQQQQQNDDALYNALVSCQQQQLSQSTSSNQQQQSVATTTVIDEEDDDPIHTFLNIESYFEKELIALIQQEDVLYNSYHPNYRNVKLKLEVWDEIARKLKKTVKQCRLKWKALRDQFIREHKRLKNRDNVESLPRWKHYDALSFLQKFIKHKAGDYENKSLMQIPKSEIDGDMDDDDDDHINMGGSSPLDNMKCEINQSQLQMSDLEGVNNNQSLHQQQTEHPDGLCVTSGSVGGYDDMDIDNYIMGDSDSVVDDHNNHDDVDEDEERKSQQDFSVYHTNHNADDVNMHSTNLDTSNQQAFKTTSPQTLQQTSTGVAEQQQSQHMNMPSLDLSDSSGNLITPDNLKNVTTTMQQTSFQTSNLVNGTSISLTPTLELCSATTHHAASNNTTPVTVPTTSEASTNTPQPQSSNNNPSHTISNNSVNSEDDEVGAFFKAVAMKIRNAKLSPVAFTDLQIDILKVINGSLRNH
ncbi:homeobox protein 13 [Musca vetustissima]|uniref:homeobox protein 13 n=1 Tax=Musca vetustissima TaxID=27455 RepID=UPI002AB60806|nr:homeobox protein 13 [Musca vetustissima]